MGSSQGAQKGDDAGIGVRDNQKETRPCGAETERSFRRRKGTKEFAEGEEKTPTLRREPNFQWICAFFKENQNTHADSSEHKLYRIGDYARYMGVTPDFLKHYEENGLLEVQYTSSGYRYYDFDQSSRILEYMRLRNYGVTVKDMSRMLSAEDGEALRLLDEKRSACALKCGASGRARRARARKDLVRTASSTSGRLGGSRRGALLVPAAHERTRL